jgi:hypothetical protein
MSAITINFLRPESHFERIVQIGRGREVRVVRGENFVEFHSADLNASL